MVLKLVLDGHDDTTPPVTGTVALTAYLIFSILAVRKDANSSQALVDRCSEATGTGGFVSLSAVANRAWALLLFVDNVWEEGLPWLFQFYKPVGAVLWSGVASVGQVKVH